MIEASAARSASIPFGAPCEPPTAHESWGTPHRHRRGRVAAGRQIRRDHVCELVILDCGAGHNFELELSERRIAADLAGQLHPSSIRRASLVPGQEVAVDLRLLAGLWLRRVRVPRESGLTTAAASPIVLRSGCIQAASIRTASRRISGRVMPAAASRQRAIRSGSSMASSLEQRLGASELPHGWCCLACPPPADGERPVDGTGGFPNVTRTSLAGLRGGGYARLSSSTGMVRIPAVWRAYSAKPG